MDGRFMFSINVYVDRDEERGLVRWIEARKRWVVESGWLDIMLTDYDKDVFPI
jgi:hypothetical protein